MIIKSLVGILLLSENSENSGKDAILAKSKNSQQAYVAVQRKLLVLI